MSALNFFSGLSPSRFVLLSRRKKQVIAVAIDFILLLVAFWTALALRFDTLSPPLATYAWQMVCAPLFAIPIFIRLGLYRAVVRYMEDKVVFTVVTGVSLSVGVLAAASALAQSPLARGALFIYWLLAIVYVAATRFVARAYFLRAEMRHGQWLRVAIYGAGRTGTQLAYALRADRHVKPLLFFDDHPSLWHMNVAGLTVFAPDDLVKIVQEKRIDELLLAIPSASRQRRAEIIRRLDGVHCHVRIVPSMSSLVTGQWTDAVREVEIEDLLGRDAVAPDAALLARCVEGKNVLVSGAGGSIGSELCRQIVRLSPKTLVLVEMNEYALYAIEQELRALCHRLAVSRGATATVLAPILGSVLNERRMARVMNAFQVQSVYHAAAYKHVPLVEHNPLEGIRNNVFGTRNLARAAGQAGVSHFVLISTDKAVRPTNVMGASKRLSELMLQAFAKEKQYTTRFTMVRFGNVLGSSGSVVPLFREQIAKGGPITLTHPDITRFFMTIPEAAQLVIQAGALSDKSGADGTVYVLDMGKPVKIFDLARRMIHLSGLELRDGKHPEGDIAIDIVGLRPGEKLYEELIIGENITATEHPLIMRAQEHEEPLAVLEAGLKHLDEAGRCFAYDEVLRVLGELVREYQPVHHDNAPLLWQNVALEYKESAAVATTQESVKPLF